MNNDELIQICEAEGVQILKNNCGNVSAMRAFQVVYVLGTLLENKQCSEGNALQFFCTVINTLRGNNTSVSSLTEECIQVRDDSCSSEWRIAENLFSISIPSCHSFKKGVNVTFSSAPIQACPDMFEVFCGSLCLPSCHEISLLRDGLNTPFRAWFTVVYVITLIGGVITIIASIIHREKMYICAV